MLNPHPSVRPERLPADKERVRNLAALRFTCREALGSGVALIDCDIDGRLDLYLVNCAPIRIKVRQQSGLRSAAQQESSQLCTSGEVCGA